MTYAYDQFPHSTLRDNQEIAKIFTSCFLNTLDIYRIADDKTYSELTSMLCRIYLTYNPLEILDDGGNQHVLRLSTNKLYYGFLTRVAFSFKANISLAEYEAYYERILRASLKDLTIKADTLREVQHTLDSRPDIVMLLGMLAFIPFELFKPYIARSLTETLR